MLKRGYIKYLSLSLIAISTLNARIGESEQQLIERFGKPGPVRIQEKVITEGRSFPIGNLIMFRSGIWSVQATMIDGKCQRIKYSKSGKWTEEQVRELLKANSSGLRWFKGKKDNQSEKHWIKEGGGTAVWNTIAGMDFKSPEYYKEKEAIARRAKQESAAKPNF